MRKHDLVIGLIVIQGCMPRVERDDDSAGARHFSGAEWQIDERGNVVAIRAVLVERSDDGHGRIVGSDSLVPLSGSMRGGVLRVVEVRSSGRRILDLTPLSGDDFDERLRSQDARSAPTGSGGARFR